LTWLDGAGYRGAFLLESGPPQLGQVDPLRLGQLIVSRSPFDRELLQVRVYRGQPDASKDPIGYAANLRQCNTWRHMPKVQVVTRTLRYPPGWPACAPGERPQEKGIDVALAIDFVAMAVRGFYDVGVIMSTDTDLKPALETVRGLGGHPRCEVAAWSASHGHSRRLAISGARIWCHWLDDRDYRAVEDAADYGKPSRSGMSWAKLAGNAAGSIHTKPSESTCT